jgi:RNA polymerase sigma-70 factor (ECF subfamily)
MSSSVVTSLSLLDRLCDGDAEAWRRLVALYEPLLRRWLPRASLQAADRDDLVQQVLAVLVRKLPTFRHNGRPGAFRAWLRGITLHELHNFFRRRPPAGIAAADPDVLDHVVDPVDALARAWDEEYTRHMVSGLLALAEPQFSHATWRAFRRLALEGVAPHVAAAELGTTVNAVTIAKCRVLAWLRQEGRGLVD